VKCGRHTERIEKVSGPHLKKCPHCSGRVDRLLSRPAIQFKGSGWYVTDYAAKSAKSDSDSGAGATSAEPGSSAAKDSTAKETATKETKKSDEKKSVKKK